MLPRFVKVSLNSSPNMLCGINFLMVRVHCASTSSGLCPPYIYLRVQAAQVVGFGVSHFRESYPDKL